MSVPNEALSGLERESWIKRLSAFDWIWAALVIIGVVWPMANTTPTWMSTRSASCSAPPRR
jgi:hypothetical protein